MSAARNGGSGMKRKVAEPKAPSAKASRQSDATSFARHLSKELTEAELSALDGVCSCSRLRVGSWGEQQFFHKLPASVPNEAELLSDEPPAQEFAPFLRDSVAGLVGAEFAPLLRLLADYKDAMYADRTPDTAQQLRACYCAHVLNHLHRTRQEVLRNNEAAATAEAAAEAARRDRGFARPKALLLLPVRESALRAVRCLVSLLPAGSFVSNRARFEREFGAGEAAEKRRVGKKPPDYEELFGGNGDDNFRLGVGIAKKTLKLYTAFAESDLIVASPLGLADIVAEQRDLLSSVEIVVVDQAEAILMQNWCRLLDVFDALNLVPDSTEANLFRCRLWYLEARARLYRQTLLLSSALFPELERLFAQQLRNYEGKASLLRRPPAPAALGLLRRPVSLKVVQFDSAGCEDAAARRLGEFQRRLLPSLRQGNLQHVLLYASSYLDWADLRRLLRRESLDFCGVSEYTGASRAARLRRQFREGDTRLLLLSERFHFFFRQRLRGIRNLLFYSPPTLPQFFVELCDLAALDTPPGQAIGCTVLIDRSLDSAAMQRICGSALAR